MSHVCRRFGHGEGISGIRADLLSVLCPVDKIISRSWCCRQSAALTIGVSAIACHSASVDRIGRGSDGKALGLEVGHQSAVACHGEGIAWIGGYYVTVLSPVGEGVTRIGRGTDGTRLAFIIGSSSRNASSVVRVG